MTTPTSYPWVDYQRTLIKGVNSDNANPLCGVDTCNWIVNSIDICNTSKNDIRVNFFILSVDDTNNYYLIYNSLIPINTSKEFLFSKTLLSGDLIYGFSDDVYNIFDCHISYLKLLETAS